MFKIITQNGRQIYIVFQVELCDPITVGDYVRAYCHIHSSDHQRSLSINKANGWGHCFNAECDATVLVAEWNPIVAQRIFYSYYRESPSHFVHPAYYASTSPPPKPAPSVTQPVLLLPAKAPPLWQQEERLALLSLDKQMRNALIHSERARAYLHERGIPLRVALAAGIGYLPVVLLRHPRVYEKQALLRRWTERLLFPLDSPDGKGYIGRSLWRWVPGMDENEHKALLDQPRAPRRWIKTNPAGWFGYQPDELSRGIILVEGAFDRLALLTAGMKATDVVALAGTAIRPDWFPAHVSTVVLALDADAGGESATQRLLERLEQAGIRAQVCPPPQDRWGKDWSERWRTMGVASVLPIFEARSSLETRMQPETKGA